ncbi:tyrosine-type recombinase/integrase [Vagococcus fluvialis]|uniref:Site-specific integrase n=1 Tax=Vagococcus silagei TaxID=2508885 RepID=A0A4V3TUW5_9ENTE|nr:tyrosine-type recombinase/integrase [Vagococcus silagei]THB60559.1 site-specific integrase [Vagococcus silagei]
MTKRQLHNVQPIKDSVILKQVKDTLLDSFKAGRRNYTIFQLGKATLLRASDVLSLEYLDVFTEDGVLKKNAYIKDKKTGKPNNLYLNPAKEDLLVYQQWRQDNQIESKWLFPSSTSPDKHITTKQYYKVMKQTGDLLSINYLGTHTMRKTGAYLVYEQSGYNIGLVMKLLNHSDQNSTLKYLGLDEIDKEERLDKINFG